jgi:hypothetical protein
LTKDFSVAWSDVLDYESVDFFVTQPFGALIFGPVASFSAILRVRRSLVDCGRDIVEILGRWYHASEADLVKFGQEPRNTDTEFVLVEIDEYL